MTPSIEKRLLSEIEAARYCGLKTKQTFRKHFGEHLKPIERGGRRLYDKWQLDLYLSGATGLPGASATDQPAPPASPPDPEVLAARREALEIARRSSYEPHEKP